MLSFAKVNLIKRLLAEGTLSQRKIAAALGVSRGVVDAIASGRRPDYAARSEGQPDTYEPLGPVDRCPSCGGRVYMPCRLCSARFREQQEQERLKELRRQARERSLRQLLVAVLRAADASQLRDATPQQPLPAESNPQPPSA